MSVALVRWTYADKLPPPVHTPVLVIFADRGVRYYAVCFIDSEGRWWNQSVNRYLDGVILYWAELPEMPK